MDSKGDKHGYLRKCGVIAKAIGVSGSTRGKGSLGSASNESATPSRAKLEGGATKTPHIKKSLKGLKGGGTEKELREGHNSRGGMGKLAAGLGAAKNKMAKSGATATMEGHGFKTPPKAKPKYDFNTNPIKAAKQDRKEDVAAAKRSGVKGAVKTAKAVAKSEMRVARGVRQARNEMGFRKADRAAGKAARMEARQTNAQRKKSVGTLGALAKM